MLYISTLLSTLGFGRTSVEPLEPCRYPLCPEAEAVKQIVLFLLVDRLVRAVSRIIAREILKPIKNKRSILELDTSLRVSDRTS